MDTVVVAPFAVAVVVSTGPAPPSTSGRTNPASCSDRAATPLDCTWNPWGSTVSPLPCSMVTTSGTA
jgi:hypothetical protein